MVNKERKYVNAVKAVVRGSFVYADEYFGTIKLFHLDDICQDNITQNKSFLLVCVGLTQLSVFC